MTRVRKRQAVAAIAVAATLIAACLWNRRQDTRRIQTESAAAAAQRTLPVHNLVRIERSRPKLQDSAPVSPPARRDEAGDDGATDWAVIAATYREYEAAESRASELRRQMSNCACAVYPERGEGSKYYVLLGSGFKRPDAYRLRERALVSGLPADTYVTRIDSGKMRARSTDPR